MLDEEQHNYNAFMTLVLQNIYNQVTGQWAQTEYNLSFEFYTFL